MESQPFATHGFRDADVMHQAFSQHVAHIVPTEPGFRLDPSRRRSARRQLQRAGVGHQSAKKDGVFLVFGSHFDVSVLLLRQADLSLWWGGNIEYSERGLHGQFQRCTCVDDDAIRETEEPIL
jgi:hypothetical protein